MSGYDRSKGRGRGRDSGGPTSHGRPAPGKVALTDRLRRRAAPAPGDQAAAKDAAADSDAPAPGGVVQSKQFGVAAVDDDRVQTTAATGVAGATGHLPHHDAIQESFGRHDVSQVRAQVGGEGATAAGAIGAEAYAVGDRAAFAAAPDLHTAAHEAAHTVQQRAGVQLLGGVGAAGDRHERHADRVADAVVAGRSAEPLLDEMAPGHATTPPAMGVQRKAAPPVPHTSRELEVIVLDRGATILKVTVTTSWGETGAAGDGAKDVGPIDEVSWSALQPKMVTEANSMGLRLEAALISAEYELDVFEGLALSLELTGPEGTFDLENGADLSLVEIAVKAEADVLALGGVEPPAGASFTVAIEGSFTIGGKLLAKLAEMSARATRLAAKADELAKFTDELAKAAAVDQDLTARRKRLVTVRDALDWENRADRKRFDKQIRDLDVEISDNRGRIHAGAFQSAAMQGELAEEAKKLSALEKKLDGKMARKLGRRISRAAAKKIGRVLAKLVPVLNLVSTVADVVAVIQLFAEWAENNFDLPNDGDFNPFGEISWEKGTEGGEGEPDADQPGDAQDGGEPAEPNSEPTTEEAPDAPAPEQDRKPEPGGDVPVTVPDQLHPAAKAVLDAIEGKGVRLDEMQVIALERIVPASLSDEELARLLQALGDQGDGLASKDAHEVLAAVDQAVRDLHAPTVRVKVDGKDRPDLGTEPEGDASSSEGADRTTEGEGSKQGDRSPEPDGRAGGERDGGEPDGSAGPPAASDLATIVFHLPESVVESWLSFRRGLVADGFDAWRDGNVDAPVPGHENWTLRSADIDIGESPTEGSWLVSVTFTLETPDGPEPQDHHFFVKRGEDGRPAAESVLMFTVRSRRG